MRLRVYVILIVNLVVCSHLARAEDYFLEGRVSYESLDGEFSDKQRREVDATFYFRPISQSVGPLAETAFLSRATFVNMGWLKSDTDLPLATISSATLNTSDGINLPALLDPLDMIIGVPIDGAVFISPVSFVPPESNLEEKEFKIAMRYVTNSGYIAQAGFNRGDGSSGFTNSFFSSDSDTETHSLEFQFGQYITPYTTILLGIRGSDREQDTFEGSSLCNTTLMCFGTLVPRLTRDDVSTELWSVSAKHLIFAGNITHAVSARVAYEVSERVFNSVLLDESGDGISFTDKSYATILGAAYTYYPRNTLGLSIDLNRIDAEASNTLQLGVRAQWFIHPTIAVDLAYRRNDIDLEFLDADTDGWSLGITGRY